MKQENMARIEARAKAHASSAAQVPRARVRLDPLERAAWECSVLADALRVYIDETSEAKGLAVLLSQKIDALNNLVIESVSEAAATSSAAE